MVKGCGPAGPTTTPHRYPSKLSTHTSKRRARGFNGAIMVLIYVRGIIVKGVKVNEKCVSFTPPDLDQLFLEQRLRISTHE